MCITILNIKLNEYKDKGFYYIKKLDISVQGPDTNKCLLEIINQCIVNNIVILMEIKLNDNSIVKLSFNDELIYLDKPIIKSKDTKDRIKDVMKEIKNTNTKNKIKELIKNVESPDKPNIIELVDQISKSKKSIILNVEETINKIDEPCIVYNSSTLYYKIIIVIIFIIFLYSK
jgi:hypothetical protein